MWHPVFLLPGSEVSAPAAWACTHAPSMLEYETVASPSVLYAILGIPMVSNSRSILSTAIAVLMVFIVHEAPSCEAYLRSSYESHK